MIYANFGIQMLLFQWFIWDCQWRCPRPIQPKARPSSTPISTKLDFTYGSGVPPRGTSIVRVKRGRCTIELHPLINEPHRSGGESFTRGASDAILPAFLFGPLYLGILALEIRVPWRHLTSCLIRVPGIGCVPEDAVACDEGLSCQAGSTGYICGEDQLVYKRLRVPPYPSALLLTPNTDWDRKLVSLLRLEFHSANVVDLLVEKCIQL